MKNTLNALLTTRGVPRRCLILPLVSAPFFGILIYMRRVFITLTNDIEIVITRMCAVNPKMSPSGAFLSVLHNHLGLPPRPTRAPKKLKNTIQVTKEIMEYELKVLNAQD